MSFDPRQSNPVGIILILVTLAGLLSAMALGQFVAHNEFSRLGIVLASGIALATCLTMGKHIWLLIPVFTSFTGSLGFLPIPFTVNEMAYMTAFAVFLIYLCMHRISLDGRLTMLDVVLALNIVNLGAVWLRNPAGASFLGSEIVGGRPYFVVLVSVLAYITMSSVRLSPKQARWMPLVIGIPLIIMGSITAFTVYFPRYTPILFNIYTGFDVSSYLSELSGNTGSALTRPISLGQVGGTGIRMLYAYFSAGSLLSISYPWRTLVLVICFSLVGLSGFRGSLVGSAFGIACSAFIRGKIIDVVKFAFWGGLGIFLLIFVHSSGLTLPLSAQRALSWLPGDWDRTAVDDAEASSDWRFRMWKTVFQNREFIKEPLWGDGFGYTAFDLEIQMRQVLGGQGYIGGEDNLTQMITGAYHSGPLSTIRYAGIVGLLLYTWLIIYSATLGLRIFKRVRGTGYEPFIMFLLPSLIWFPITFFTIFGGFDSDLPRTIISAGFLRILQRSMETNLPSNAPKPRQLEPQVNIQIKSLVQETQT